VREPDFECQNVSFRTTGNSGSDSDDALLFLAVIDSSKSSETFPISSRRSVLRDRSRYCFTIKQAPLVSNRKAMFPGKKGIEKEKERCRQFIAKIRYCQ
jgi:hypothetical protein